MPTKLYPKTNLTGTEMEEVRGKELKTKWLECLKKSKKQRKLQSVY